VEKFERGQICIVEDMCSGSIDCNVFRLKILIIVIKVVRESELIKLHQKCAQFMEINGARMAGDPTKNILF
jgi:hypothetical protein